MDSVLSIELPESLSELVSTKAIDQYTLATADPSVRPALEKLTIDQLFPGGVVDRDMAKCCISGLWLLHNFLDPSHEISQAVHTREGSFWHAIMHRLEGDFSNSKYWYRKVGEHPVFENMPDPGTWDPDKFVDQCESAQDGDSTMKQQIQQTAVDEWKTLFEYCFQHAT